MCVNATAEHQGMDTLHQLNDKDVFRKGAISQSLFRNLLLVSFNLPIWGMAAKYCVLKSL